MLVSEGIFLPRSLCFLFSFLVRGNIGAHESFGLRAYKLYCLVRSDAFYLTIARVNIYNDI